MPTKTPVSKTYPQSTCTVSVQGETLTPEAIATLTPPVSCTIQLPQGESTHQFEGDGELLHDLVTTIDRYLAYMLSAQAQGTFSGSVAIRPLDAVRHRITLRQGNGIGQADLTISQLYDLAESLGEVKQAIPHLEQLKTPALSIAWYRRPATGIAALAAIGVGIAAASVMLTRPSAENLGVTEYRVEQDTTQLAETPPAAQVPSEPAAEAELPQRSADSAGERGLEDAGPEAPLVAPAVPSSDPAVAVPGLAQREEDLPSADLGEVDEFEVNDLAALSRQAPPEFDSSMLEQLESTWAQDWQSPASLTEELIYELTVASDGSILSAVPASDRAQELQPQTPFADVPPTSEGAGTIVRATLGPEDAVSATLSPQPPSVPVTP